MTKVEIMALKYLGIASGVAVFFTLVGMLANRSLEFWYLPWNLFLAWTGAIVSCTIVAKQPSGWVKVGLFALWILLLPNSFYIITDIIHINDATRFDQTLDVLTFMSTIIPGFWLGFFSLGQIDAHVLKHLGTTVRVLCVTAIALLCGFAIYIGRELRWNSWDAILHPLRLASDLAHTISNPGPLLHLAVATLGFAVLILGLYRALLSFSAWQSSASR